MRETVFYKVGGALVTDQPSYVERPADDALLERIRQGDYCYVLATRQMGKTSLKARTCMRLAAEGRLAADVDLTTIGSKDATFTADQWYYGFAFEVLARLGMEPEPKATLDAWWNERGRLPPTQRLVRFLREVVLGRTSAPVVVFIDEIESTLELPFSDDFFAALRSCLNARATDREFDRLSFVLMGVASPTDLMKDPQRTPFNVATRVDLSDFTREEATPLAEGLGGTRTWREAVLERVLYWTGGHPFLTQKVLQVVARSAPRTDDGEPDAGGSPIQVVDRYVEREFLSAGANPGDDNLKFVLSRVSGRGSLTRAMLRLYRRVLIGPRVNDEPTDRVQTELKLAGLVKASADGSLQVRNRIYAQVFDRAWVRQAMPAAWTRRGLAASVSLSIAILVGGVGWIYPSQLVNQIRQAPTDYPEGRKTFGGVYRTLHGFPFYAGAADREWARFGLERMRTAITLDSDDTRATGRRDAFRLMQDAVAQGEDLLALPSYRTDAATLLASFFAARAERAQWIENRDLALLWWLKALSNAPGNEQYRRAAGQLAGADYDRLIETSRLVGFYGILRASSRRSPVLSPDGRRFALIDLGRVLVKDLLQPAEPPIPLKFDASMLVDNRVARLRFSTDGRYLMAMGADAPVYLWDLRQPERLADQRMTGYRGAFSCAMSPDNHLLATFDTDGRIRVWDLDRKGAIPLPIAEDRRGAGELAFSPSGRRLAAGGDKGLTVWEVDVVGKKMTPVAESRLGVRVMAFGPDDRRLFTESVSNHLYEWDLHKKVEEQVTVVGSFRGVRSLALSRGGRRMSAGCTNGSALVWDVNRIHEPPAVFRASESSVWAAIGDDERELITVDDPGVKRVWDLRGIPAQSAGLLSVDHGHGFDLCVISGNGQRVAAVDRSGRILIWDIASVRGTPIASLRAESFIRSVAVDDTGRHLAGGFEKAINVWNLDQPEVPPLRLEAPGGQSQRLCLAADGKKLAAGATFGQRTLLWDLQRPEDREEAPGEAYGLFGLALDPEGRWLALTATNGTSLVRLSGVRESHRLTPASMGGALAFSADGRWLADGDRAGVIRLWDTSQPARPHSFLQAVGSAVAGLRFSREVREIAAITRSWAHLAHISDGGGLVPQTSRLFPPGLLPGNSGADLLLDPPSVESALSFLDGPGLKARVPLLVTGTSILPATLNFDAYEGVPLEGDPESLLTDWQRRLALAINGAGEIAPVWASAGGTEAPEPITAED
jgi:WD40 repeat protein